MMTYTFLQEMHARRTFPHYDRNNDGFISVRDVNDFLNDIKNRYGLDKPVPSDTEINKLALVTDHNEDGRLDLAEFTQAWTPPIPDLLLKLRFETYDLDESGSFDQEEYKKVLSVLGQVKSNHRQFPFYDMNNDGKVTWEEYARRESKCDQLNLLRIHYNNQTMGSPGVIYDMCQEG